ncbi:MAG: tetratricopeptide repeat protein [Bacteroidales bacterium]|nr:tetratricopeptide repeat protein [Bacteroidales bacterium]
MNFSQSWNIIIKRPWIGFLVIVGVTFLLYSGTIKYGILFNYDDDAYFNDAGLHQLSFSKLLSIFQTFHLGMYQPLSALSFALLFDLFPGSVEAQRIANILLHLINAFLVWRLILAFSKDQFVSLLSAFIFAIHPMHVESVTWIAARGNLLYSLFYLLSLLAFVKFRTQASKWSLPLLLLSFLLALSSKVTSATLPFIILLADLLYFKSSLKKSLIVFIPMLLLSLAFVWIGVSASGSFGHIAELSNNYSLPDRLILILNALWIYLYKAILPLQQSVIYLYPWTQGGKLPLSYYLEGGACIVLLATLFFIAWKKRNEVIGKFMLAGLIFFLISVAIVLPLKWSRTILIAERYTYLPYLGLFLAILMVGKQWFIQSGKLVRSGLLSVLVGMILFFAVASFQRNKVWENPNILFTDVIAKDRSNAEVSMGHYNRGNEYLRLGNHDAALSDYTEAIKLNPEYVEAYFNRGLTRLLDGEYQSAIDDLSTSIKIDDRNPDAFLNRGIAYRSIGENEKALQDFNASISRLPSALAYFNRGALYYFNLGQPEKACSDWLQWRNMGYSGADEVLNQFCQ